MANDFFSKIKIDGTTYNVKVPNGLKVGTKTFDGSSEIIIAASDLGLSNALQFIGETTETPLSDGSTTSSVKIGSTTHTAATGDVVLYGAKEFVWQGSEWRELGDGSSHALKTVKIEVGEGLTLDKGGTLESDTKISHKDTSSQESIPASGRRYITGVTLDGYGHVTGLTTGTETVTAPTTPSEVGAAPKTAGVYLVKGNTTGTAGTWTGSSDYISSYYDGLVVAYDIGIEGASTTTLNINGLGAKTVYLRGTTKLTTHYAVGTIILLTYSADDGCWYKADYDANTNTQIRIYRQTSGYNADYPIIVSRTATSSIGTAGTNSSYSAVYGVIGQNGTYTPTINPHTGEGKFKTVTATTFNGDLSGNATTATTADNATKLNGQAASYYAKASDIPTDYLKPSTVTAGVTSTSTLAAGNNATATAAWDSTNKKINFTFGIPKGANGSNGTNGTNGAQGYSVVATVDRQNFTEAQWSTYGTVGHLENWGNTSNSGVRVGDIFFVAGTSTDAGKGHLLVYQYQTYSGSTLYGKCLGHHIISAKGAKGDKGDAGVNATTTAVATTISNGLMSAADKTKLDSTFGANAITDFNMSSGTTTAAEVGDNGIKCTTDELEIEFNGGTDYNYCVGNFTVPIVAGQNITIVSNQDDKAEISATIPRKTSELTNDGDSGSNAYVITNTGDQTKLAIGAGASSSNTNNIAIGSAAACIGGPTAIALGSGASANGASSVAIGYLANASGTYNVSVGTSSGYSNSIEYTTAIGYNAKPRYEKSIAIGYNVSTPTSASATRLGSSYTSTGRALLLGVGGTGYTYMNAAGASWTSASDVRDKTDIENIDGAQALEFITKVNPITYVMNNRDDYCTEEECTDENGETQIRKVFNEAEWKTESKKKHRRFAGVSAQDTYATMQEVFGSDNYAQIVDWSRYDNPDEDTPFDTYTVAYERFVPFLIGAVKEQQKQIDELKQQIAELQNK